MTKVINSDKNIILTDCDGVLLNWEYAFDCWMAQHGYPRNDVVEYDVLHKYGLGEQKSKEMVRFFNESAAIGFLPPLRDAMYYVDLLHRKCGYTFHLLTSLSLDQSANKLRTQNIQKLFGETAFSKFIYLDTGADKDQELAKYRHSGVIWIEDKIQNAVAGAQQGLRTFLMEHNYNMDYKNDKIQKVKNWKELYDTITS